MFAQRLLPVVVLEDEAWALPLADALQAGGLDVVEITLRTKAALAGIAQIRARHPALTVGAGTVLDAGIVPRLADLGVGFLVSPGLNARVVAAAAAAGLPLLPGVATPTDIEAARALGLTTLKFFPAEPLGGVAMLEALGGPYGPAGIRFVPTGGINLDNAKAYAALPAVAAIGGSWFVAAKLMRAGRWAEITALTRAAVAVMAR
jgi:2-dehydro-3-deoxyphosphogluconate aldolase/(4S)-4-hydroxy-2-oxoglutarate aldolase